MNWSLWLVLLPQQHGPKLYDLEFRLGDDPGSLAALTEFLGREGISIELGESRTTLCNVRAEVSVTALFPPGFENNAKKLEGKLKSLVQIEDDPDIRLKIKPVHIRGDTEIWLEGKESPLKSYKFLQTFAPGIAGKAGRNTPENIPINQSYSKISENQLKVPDFIISRFDKHFKQSLKANSFKSVAGDGYAIVVADFNTKLLTITLPNPGSRIVELKFYLKDDPGAIAEIAKFLSDKHINLLETRVNTLVFGETVIWRVIADFSDSPYRGYSDRQLAGVLEKDMKVEGLKLLKEERPVHLLGSVGEASRGGELFGEAYGILYDFENKFKSFTQRKLEEVYGDNWWNAGIPGDVREKAEKRKTKEEQEPFSVGKGIEERPMISYIAFVDYVKIIQRKDNWERAFKPVFKEVANVIARLKGIEPIRNKIAHVEEISKDEFESLKVHTREILRAIEKWEENQ